MMRTTTWLLGAAIVAAPMATLAGPRVAATDKAPPPTTAVAPAATATRTTTAAASPGAGLALGVEVGEPTSATVGWFTGKLAVIGAIGSGTLAGVGVHVHADAQLEVARLAPNMPLRIGLGARYLPPRLPARPRSTSSRTPTSVSARPRRSPIEHGSMQLYAELAPGIDVKRTASCTLADGANSICPHAQATPLFLEFVVGARWFLSH